MPKTNRLLFISNGISVGLSILTVSEIQYDGQKQSCASKTEHFMQTRALL